MLSFFRLVNVARVTNTSLSGLEALRCAPFLPISARIHTPIVGHTTEILVWILNTLAGFEPAFFRTKPAILPLKLQCMTAWGATVSEITVASSVISRTNNSTRTARTSFYWKNLYLWSCFSISARIPINFSPADCCSSAGTGTLKSRQFFNGNCQTPMDTAGYAPAILSYELNVFLLN